MRTSCSRPTTPIPTSPRRWPSDGSRYLACRCRRWKRHHRPRRRQVAVAAVVGPQDVSPPHDGQARHHGTQDVSVLKKPLDGRDNHRAVDGSSFRAGRRDYRRELLGRHDARAHPRLTRGADEIMVIGGAAVFERPCPTRTASTGRRCTRAPRAMCPFPRPIFPNGTRSSARSCSRGEKNNVTATL